jgi:acid phosphatase
MANPNTAVFITFDEASGGSQGPTPTGNGVPMIVVSPYTSRVTDATQFNHYSLLRTVEDLFGLPALGSAASAPSMVGSFGL